MNQLALIEKMTPMEAYAPNNIDKILNGITEEVKAQTLDVSTEAGRKEVASLAYKVARSKTFLDDLGKKLGEEAQAKLNAINAERKKSRDYLDTLKEEIRKPLTDWEVSERKRVEAHQEAIQQIITTGKVFETSWPSIEIVTIEKEIESIKSIERDWEEFLPKASMEIATCVEKLELCLSNAKTRAAEQAELARLREEKASRDRAEELRLHNEKVLREKAEAEAKAKADQEAREKREAEIKAEHERRLQAREKQLAEEKAQAVEREKMNAELKAKEAVENERRRIEREAMEARAAEQKREANKRHKSKINNEVLSALMLSGITEDQGKKIVTSIALGEVPHTRISY